MTQTVKVSQCVSHLPASSFFRPGCLCSSSGGHDKQIIHTVISQAAFPDLTSRLPHNHHLSQSPGALPLSFLLLPQLISHSHLPLASHSVSPVSVPLMAMTNSFIVLCSLQSASSYFSFICPSKPSCSLFS